MKKFEGYAILCDMDGVIISIKERWIDPVESALRKVKHDIDKEKIKNEVPKLLLSQVGKSTYLWVRVIKSICKAVGLTRFQIFRFLVKLAEMMITQKHFHIVPFEGVEETLLKLRSMGFKLALVTTASKFTIRKLKKRFPNIYYSYDIILTRNDVKFTKPFPEQLIKAMDKLKVTKDKCLMIGDLQTDVIAGKNAGVKTVAVHSEFPFITKYLLEHIQPDYQIESFNDLPEIVGLIFNTK